MTPPVAILGIRPHARVTAISTAAHVRETDAGTITSGELVITLGAASAERQAWAR